MSMLLVLVLSPFSLGDVLGPAQQAPPPAVRMVDLTGDGLLDKLFLGPAGRLRVSVNRGGGLFAPVRQRLPSVYVADVLCTDLDGDGLPDLYLVSTGENLALLGDGTGRLRDATVELSLGDRGPGASAERVDLDGVGREELLLHNRHGDVVFWARPSGFERDADTPELALTPGSRSLEPLAAWILEAAADPSLLGDDVSVHLGTSPDGRPVVTLGPASAGTLLGGVSFASGGAMPSSRPSASGSIGGSTADAVSGKPEFTSDHLKILKHMSIVDLPDGEGATTRTIRIQGVNLQIVNGTGATNGLPGDPGNLDGGQTHTNGLGNLIVGYNELRGAGDRRTGSHNIIIGRQDNYSSFGGLVVGDFNSISGAYSSVSGGHTNSAMGTWSSVAGGNMNVAGPDGAGRLGVAAMVAGGRGNFASGDFSSILGGGDDPEDLFDAGNVASGRLASIAGGVTNTASGVGSVVAGGMSNLASGAVASVGGGRGNQSLATGSAIAGGGNTSGGNIASGEYAVVSGGFGNVASGISSSVTGGRNNTASGIGASISGGGSATGGNFASGPMAWIGGGTGNEAAGQGAVIGAGLDNRALGPWTSIMGGQNNTALGPASTIMGGAENTTSGDQSAVAGGFQNRAAGFWSVVNGGYQNVGQGLLATVNGGTNNDAGGSMATVGGGANRSAPGANDWSAGSLLEDD